MTTFNRRQYARDCGFSEIVVEQLDLEFFLSLLEIPNQQIGPVNYDKLFRRIVALEIIRRLNNGI